jgi:3-deoxy-7-phosphoheptulonate synthase
MSRNGTPEMMIVMRQDAPEDAVATVVSVLEGAGAYAHVSYGREATVIGAIGEREQIASLPLEGYPGVEQVVPLLKPYRFVSREFVRGDTVIDVLGHPIGGPHFALYAGPCSIESHEQLLAAALAVRDAGGSAIRGGAFKPRTSPYDFKGLGVEALRILRAVGDEVGLPVMTELMDARDLPAVYEHVDVIWIGARNMQNFNLLCEVGGVDKPVMLKRGISATVEELLMAAEYVAKEGNERIILCERGIRTFERSTRFTLDVGAIPVLKAETHLPVIVDPSHAAGRRALVAPLARAALVAGADGLIVETHPDPDHALSDAAQQIRSDAFAAFSDDIRRYLAVSGKTLAA